MKSLEEYEYDLIRYNLNTYGLDYLHVDFEHANGCGAKGGTKFPSTMWWVNIESACIGHDIRWALAKCYEDLLEANEIFDNDLKRICDKESSCTLFRWLRRMRIAKYVSGVELIGTEAYANERGFERRGWKNSYAKNKYRI